MEVSYTAWCLQKWQEATEAGDTEAADNYQKLYDIWKEKE